jgi:hypothetical protein
VLVLRAEVGTFRAGFLASNSSYELIPQSVQLETPDIVRGSIGVDCEDRHFEAFDALQSGIFTIASEEPAASIFRTEE